MKGRDSNPGRKTTFSSFSSNKTSSFLGIFAKCFRDQNAAKPEPQRKTIQHPSIKIDIDKPPAKSFLSNLSQDEPTCHSIRRQQDAAKVYHLDKSFILGDLHKIVAKITTKQIITSQKSSRISSASASSKDSNKQKHSEDNIVLQKIPTTVKQEIFSMYDKGIKAMEWHEITPENIAIHIAERLHCDMIIDALCGCGGNTIQFAKHCDYVLGIDIEPEKTLSARHNAHIYGVQHKIDFLTVDFLKLKNMRADVVFLGPSDIRKNPKETYSVFEHAEPDLRDLIPKSLEISCCIALKLPGDTDLEELADLFHVSLERYRLYSKRFCIEIERIVNSCNEIECIVVYFGDCSSIELNEEYQAIYDYLASNESPQFKEKYPFHNLVAILRSVGTRKFFKHIAKIEESLCSLDAPQVSLFDTFLEELIEKNIFTRHSLKRLIEESNQSAKVRAPAMNKKNPFTSNSMVISKLSSLSVETRHTSESRKIESPGILFGAGQSQEGRLIQMDYFANKPEKKVEEKVEEIHVENVEVPVEKVIWENNDNTFTFKNNNAGNSQINQKEEHEEIPEKKQAEEELSDLNVSSYSVSSGYLKESEHGSPGTYKKGKDLIHISFEDSDRDEPMSSQRDEVSLKSELPFKKIVSVPNFMHREEVENLDIRSRVSMNSKKGGKF